MKRALQDVIKKAMTDLGAPGIEPVVEVPGFSKHGDYTTNVALVAAKLLKKPPMDVALQVKEYFKNQISIVKKESHDQNMPQSDQKLSLKQPQIEVLQDIDRIEIAPPGFLNIFVTEARLISQPSKVLKEGEAYGKGHGEGDTKQQIKDKRPEIKKRIVVEFTDPNPFKEFHVGHLYSNTVGESLARLLAFQGHVVRRVNYQGDVGMHVAKAVWGLLQQAQSVKRKAQNFLKDLENRPLPERVNVLGQVYATGAKAFTDDPKAAGEMKKLNTLIFIVAQEEQPKASKGPVVDYRKGVSIDESDLEAVRLLYRQGRAWSLAYFETIYKRLGTAFDGYYFESQVGEYGMALVRKHIADGTFEESDGAVVYRGEKKGLHTRVFINSMGLPTYEAKELGLAPLKFKDWPYDLSLIVTGNEINEYFRVVMSALSEIEPELAQKSRHIGHGMVRAPDGSKLSSREGNVLTGEMLIDEAKKQIHDFLQKSDRKYTKKHQEEIAEKAAVAAIKYSLLRVALPSDIAFDMGKSISFEGDSGPYIQYAYARAKSVLRKAEESDKESVLRSKENENPLNTKYQSLNTFSLNPEEREVARLILYFPDAATDAAESFSPNRVANYLFQLAQAYNLFYAKHEILGRDTRQETRNMRQETTSLRLALTAATAHVLRNGLYLLGIDTLEEM